MNINIEKDNNELLYGLIYAIYFPNNKLYIGQTIRDIYKRIEEHKLKSKNPTLLVHKAINKYGFENIKYEVVDYAYSFEELNELEKYYINKFESYFETNKGYNMTLGGEGNHPRLNSIEQFFNQMKHYIKLDKPNTFTALDGSVKSSIDKIKPTNYENYFIYAYNKDYYKNKLNNKKYTRRRTLKIYKN